MIKMKKKKNLILLLVVAVILLLNVITTVFYGSQKDGYHLDEVYTAALSNKQGIPFLSYPGQNGGTGEDLEREITVQPKDQFSFKNVYRNQEQDVHPPLYYFFYHSIASLFPNKFSKWFGLSINIVFFIVAWIILLLLSKIVLKRWSLALLTTILWGFSSGAVSSVMWIRMYVLFTIFTLLFFYGIINAMREKRLTSKTMLVIGGSVFLGMMTHYYFVIFAFFPSLFYFVYTIFHRRVADVLKFSGTMFAALGLSVCAYPAMLDHIFSGYRGAQAMESMSKSVESKTTVLENLKIYYQVINQELFNNTSGIICFILVLFGFYTYFYRKTNGERKQKPISNLVDSIGLLIVSILGYVLIVSQISPFKVDRYVFPIYPLIVLLVIATITAIVSTYKFGKVLVIIFSVTLLSGNLYHMVVGNGVGYLYKPYKTSEIENLNKVSHYQNLLIYDQMADETVQMTDATQFLIFASRYYATPKTDALEYIKGLHLDNAPLLVYISFPIRSYAITTGDYAEPDSIINQLISNTKFKSAKLINKSVMLYLLE
ncbi:MAG TPA: hypothetical protein DIW15_03335 [Bavariicoccus seileri]|uniref:Glycosyltransferase RgtA/B/C/D-like domain-containing protein n=1 Tax=Bavariicoccus seileri TaxID=549685 RepID=A0A3D4S4H7_9ENTE|nr:hypothetical protein [Bavariicoccus seileri]HCS93729.1 hypothetical protein [Bavariicoccus seileri]